MCRENLNSNYDIKCDDNVHLSVLRCSCATYNEEEMTVTGGKCIQSCGTTYSMKELYFELPYNLTKLNQFMCEDRWNRTGAIVW